MTRTIAPVFFAALLFPIYGTCQAQEEKESLRLVNQTFHDATDQETEQLREMLNSLVRDQSRLKRFACRCEGFISYVDKPETFVSIRAVDRDLDAVRHVVTRKFTDDDDPILSFTLTGPNGYGDSRIDNGRFFPISHDNLRLGDTVFLSNQPGRGLPRDQVQFTWHKRNIDPVTCSMSVFSTFVRGPESEKPLSEAWDIDRVRPDKVALTGRSFVTLNEVHLDDGTPAHLYNFIEFVDGLPSTYEIWTIVGDYRRIVCRTTTTWKKIYGQDLPVQIEAFQIAGSRSDVLDLSFSWHFDKDVPDRLFEVSDVGAEDALRW